MRSNGVGSHHGAGGAGEAGRVASPPFGPGSLQARSRSNNTSESEKGKKRVTDNMEEVLRRKAEAEKIMAARRQALISEQNEKFRKTNEQRDREKKERARLMAEKELRRQKEALDRRTTYLEAQKQKKEAILQKAHAAHSRTSALKNKPTFAFGSSTPREISYLQTVPKDQRAYDKKLSPTSGPAPPPPVETTTPTQSRVRASPMTASMHMPPSARPVRTPPVAANRALLSSITKSAPANNNLMTQSMYAPSTTPKRPAPRSARPKPPVPVARPRSSATSTPHAKKEVVKKPVHQKEVQKEQNIIRKPPVEAKVEEQKPIVPTPAVEVTVAEETFEKKEVERVEVRSTEEEPDVKTTTVEKEQTLASELEETSEKTETPKESEEVLIDFGENKNEAQDEVISLVDEVMTSVEEADTAEAVLKSDDEHVEETHETQSEPDVSAAPSMQMSLHEELSSLLSMDEPVREVVETESVSPVEHDYKEHVHVQDEHIVSSEATTSPSVLEPLPLESHYPVMGLEAVERLGEQEAHQETEKPSETPVVESAQSDHDHEPVAEDPAPSTGREEQEVVEVPKEHVPPSIPHEEPTPSPADPAPVKKVEAEVEEKHEIISPSPPRSPPEERKSEILAKYEQEEKEREARKARLAAIMNRMRTTGGGDSSPPEKEADGHTAPTGAPAPDAAMSALQRVAALRNNPKISKVLERHGSNPHLAEGQTTQLPGTVPDPPQDPLIIQ